jgi:Transglutaminase-like superfamily
MLNAKNLFVAVLLLLCFTSFSQNNQYAEFASSHDSLMMKAYYDRKPDRYLDVLNEFNQWYNQLPKGEQANYQGYKINALYNLSCTYSVLNDKENALLYLKRAIEAGYNNYGHMQEDSDLDNIRTDEAFTKMLQPLKATGDYMYILKKAGTYNRNEKQDIPAFSYQSADNPNLAILRKAFNLDSIAGGGNEVSRILNLMHWVHNIIPHDGNHENPVVKNALSMIRECKRDNRGLNCRGLATVLNECYLSMGIKSRFVTCLPKDSLGVDPDCHVINMVYSKQLKKWIWIDPTFDAYVMDEKGNLLGMEEVRDRIIGDKPLILSPEANWNHRATETKAQYLYNYMAKNLYMLECPVSSEYDTETRETGKTYAYLRLIPLDYFKKSIEKGISTNNVNKTTNNPDFFWKAPE